MNKYKKKKLKIAIVSKLWEETSPDSRGGTGSSVGYLVNGLVDRGHHVTLFATGDSRTKAQKLISVRKTYYKNDYSEVHEYQNIAEAFKRAKDFDIIHCAVEQKSVIFADLVKTPSIHSIRYGEFFEQERDLLKKYKHLNYVGISRSLKKLLPFLNWQDIIYNGLDSSNFIQQDKPGDYLLFLARLSPQKGVDTAIKLAKRLKMKLILAGKISEADRDFLDKKVLPFIDGKQIIYKGEVLGQEKKKLLGGAFCLIQPNRLIEAFGNTFLEAMASAVPVVAYDQGAIRELVENGKTGYVVNDFNEMLGAIKKVKNIKKEDCLNRAQKYFSLDKMISSYESLYYKIIK
ncbi:glycosyltransferase family 4 protein [Patescibacteria group bacterium]|nr:glycosyltransferase family 4 protein [Patescibacteria group bacterium]